MSPEQYIAYLIKKNYAIGHHYGSVRQEEGDIETESQKRYASRYKKIRKTEER